MTAPDEDYGRRERLLLHHPHQYPPPGPTPPPGTGERYIPAPTPPPGDRYIPTSGERYIPPSGDRYHQSSSTSDRFLATSSPADRYLSPADRFLPAASSVTSDRYLPPPAPAPSDRFLPPSTPAPGERYLPPPPSATSGGPGDPYMRRDLGYHHHYRLPHPSYHPHHPHHQYHPHYHHQRALPPAPHHRSLNYHSHMVPSPNRNHNRCCPSPSHYGPSADPPYILSSAGSPGNGSASNTPSASGSGSGGTSGVVMLAAVTGSVTATGTSSSSASSVTVPSASVSTTREYITSPSPLLSHRGRTPPCSVVSQRPSVSGNNVSSSASNVPVIEYVGASGGRHVSTPTPPPSVILPRCGSLSSCDLGIENPLCGSGDAISNSTGSIGNVSHHHNHHHHNHLQQQPAQRRGCSGVLETFDAQGSTVSLCCGNSRRFAIPQQQVNASVSSAISVSAGDMSPCVTTTAPCITRPESRQSIAASGATTPSHPPLQHSTPHHSAVWRAVSQGQQQGPTPAGLSCGSGTQQITPDTTPAHSPSDHQSPGISLERSISAPASSQHCVGTRPQEHGRPTLDRSLSKTEMLRKLIRKETAVFFGVEESKEEEQQARWLDRRKRLAARKYGSLKDDYTCPDTQRPPRHQQLTSAYTRQMRDSLATGRPDVLPGGRESLDAPVEHQATTPQYWTEPPVRRKETVAHMTFGALAFVVATLTRHRPRPASTSRQSSRSYSSSTVAPCLGTSSPVADDEVFFTRPFAAAAAPAVLLAEETSVLTEDHVDPTVEPVAVVATESGFTHAREQYARRPLSWRRPPPESSDSGPEVGCSRIWSRVLDRVFDNSNRRQYGMGVVGRFFGRSMKRSVTDRKAVKEQLDDIEDHRPFFTYWVTTVQVLILFISLACYGLGPVGFDLSHRSGQVLVTSLSLQQVDYQEPANFWIGPRAADLIHLGAKFAPCMRKDAKIMKEIEKGREKERETACCIRNDDSGCVQSSQADCSKTISTWKKWSAGDSGPGGRISGSVCGLDPKFCEAPASVAPYEWPDDITKWPICRKTNSISQQRFRYKDKMAEHMVCEVIGHPCCIGIHGMCRITTKEYCDFVRGYFHEEASLCSQVSCLDDVCGMIRFYSPEVPDQFYRLWTSLFLHAGILQLCITLLIQYFLMRDLEKLTGSLRIAIIYMGSGVAGNLASAIFVPYRADVGPAGAQVGLLACLIVEVLNARPMLKHPNYALLKLIAITLVLFFFGLLPWIDNYAHLFGFFFGFLLSYALMPYVSFGQYDRQKKIALIWVCLLSSLFLFIALVILFYITPVYDCEVCSFLNCLPFTQDFCASQNINFKRQEPVV